MTDSANETKQQEIERDSLQGVISQMQGALLFATAEGRPALATALRNATSRLGFVEKKIQELQVARETEVREQTNLAAIAQSESRLNQQEQNTFAGFLKEDFFTKKDFGGLEEFYAKTWDRLSEHGKDEMSHRIWEGVRKGKYTFGELPPTVREKETKRAYQVLKEREAGTGNGMDIPEQDRSDFIRAFEAGKRDEAEKVLERESFKKNLFRGSESKAVKSAQVQTGRDVDGKTTGTQIAAGNAPNLQVQAGQNAAKAKESVQDLTLDGFKLADSSRDPSSAEIPRGTSGSVNSVPSLGRS